MTQDPSRGRPPLYSQIDVAQPVYHPTVAPRAGESDVQCLLRQLVIGQNRQNELLEELIEQVGSRSVRRPTNWCSGSRPTPVWPRTAVRRPRPWGRYRRSSSNGLTREIGDNYENLMDGEFMLNEFVDRFGPRMAHLNGILQVLAQLSATLSPAGAANAP